MALATKCPHCNTIFRVAADQLKLRGGIVRCGSCNEVFDGNAALVHPAGMAAAPAGLATPAVPVPALPTPALPTPAPASPADSVAPAPAEPEAAYTLDFDTAVETFDLPPQPAAAEALPPVAPTPPAPPPEPAAPAVPVPATDLDLELDIDVDAGLATEAPGPEPERARHPFAAAHDDGRREPSFRFEAFELPGEPELPPAPGGLGDAPHEAMPEHEADEELVAAALPGEAFPETPAHAGTEVDADLEPKVASRGKAWAARIHAEDAAANAADGEERQQEDPDEPGFVKQGRRREQTGKAVNIAMGVGSALLLAALLVQGMTTFRNQLAASVPALKPTLVSACAALGCRIDLPSQIDALSIEQGELQTLAENTFSYASLLHNQSASAQAWPSIELTLNDAADKPVLRRVFAPRDYLAAGVDTARGFAPHSEQNVKLYFELAQLKASGYHIAVFYP